MYVSTDPKKLYSGLGLGKLSVLVQIILFFSKRVFKQKGYFERQTNKKKLEIQNLVLKRHIPSRYAEQDKLSIHLNLQLH